MCKRSSSPVFTSTNAEQVTKTTMEANNDPQQSEARATKKQKLDATYVPQSGEAVEATMNAFRNFFGEFDGTCCTWSTNLKVLIQSIFHEDMRLCQSNGDGMSRDDFVDVLFALNKSLIKIELYKMKKQSSTTTMNPHNSSSSQGTSNVDCTLLFHLPESPKVTRSFRLQLELVIEDDGWISCIRLKDSTSPYVFNLLVLQSKIRSILKDTGMADRLNQPSATTEYTF